MVAKDGDKLEERSLWREFLQAYSPTRISHTAQRVSLPLRGFGRQNKNQMKDVAGSQKGKLWLVLEERELEVG